MTRDPRFSVAGQGMVADSSCSRHLLWLVWKPGAPLLGWCLLNPSTADAIKLDPTTKRVTEFTHDLGYGGWVLANLFARRRTIPFTLSDVKLLGDRWRAELGADTWNDDAILHVARQTERMILAWGSGGKLMGRDREVVGMLRRLARSRALFALGWTAAGEPKHPLARGLHRIPRGTQPEAFPS